MWQINRFVIFILVFHENLLCLRSFYSDSISFFSADEPIQVCHSRRKLTSVGIKSCFCVFWNGVKNLIIQIFLNRSEEGCSDGVSCDYAHGQEELQEWIARRDFLRQKLAKAREDMLVMPDDFNFGKYNFLIQD